MHTSHGAFPIFKVNEDDPNLNGGFELVAEVPEDLVGDVSVFSAVIAEATVSDDGKFLIGAYKVDNMGTDGDVVTILSVNFNEDLEDNDDIIQAKLHVSAVPTNGRSIPKTFKKLMKAVSSNGSLPIIPMTKQGEKACLRTYNVSELLK